MLDAAAAGLYLRSSIDQETAGIRAFDRQPGRQQAGVGRYAGRS